MQGIVPAGTPLPGKEHRVAAPPGAGRLRCCSTVATNRLHWCEIRTTPRRQAPSRGIVFKVVPDPTVRALELAEGICDLSENNIQARPFCRGSRMHQGAGNQ